MPEDQISPATTIRAMTADDADAVLDIYAEGIATGDATFAEAVPEWEAFDRAHLAEARLVAELAGSQAGRLAGWAALAPTSSRPVYAGVCEISIYVAAQARGQGVGAALMAATVQAAESAGIWTLQAGIFPENQASIRLHEGAGFRVLGTRSRVGRMVHGPRIGQWRDVVLLERRSTTVGTD